MRPFTLIDLKFFSVAYVNRREVPFVLCTEKPGHAHAQLLKASRQPEPQFKTNPTGERAIRHIRE